MRASPSANVVSFGPFRLDLKAGELHQDGRTVRLQEQPFQVLKMLVENAGEVVSREEIRHILWPDDTIVEFDQSINAVIKKLRLALEDSADQPRYIETVARRGYRLLVTVTWSEAPAEDTKRSGVEARANPVPQIAERQLTVANAQASFWRWLLALGLSAALVTIGILWVRNRSNTSSVRELKLRQLTASSIEDPIRYGAISPDGKYLAYADLKGIHTMLIQTGETQTVPQPEVFKGQRVDWQFFRWFPDGTRFLVNQNPPNERDRGYSATIWSVPAMGGLPRKLLQDAGAESISPDGTLVAFTTDGHNVWLMGPNAEQIRRLYKSPPDKECWNFRFSPTGERLMYTEFPNGILESRDLRGGNPVEILAGAPDRLRDYLWLPDGRVVYALAEAIPNVDTCNFWQLRVDVHTGKPQSAPQRLTNWAGACAENLSATADGKTIAFQQWAGHSTVYVAELVANGTHIATPFRLTVNESVNVPSGWTADSRSVIFKTSFNGETGIYKQRLDQETPEPLVTGMSDISDHTPLSPDGSWILYGAQPSYGAADQLMRTPTSGGPSQVIMSGENYGVRCARSPSGLCVIAERSLAPSFTFWTFDPLKGRGSELGKMSVDPESECFWDLSPDGRHIAVLEGLSGRIQILSLPHQTVQEIKTKGMETTSFIDWAADGKAVFVSRPTPQGFELLRLDLNGNSEVLWGERGGLGTSALASPDGKHLAIRGWSVTSNFWTMTNF